jgi:hypothetical protein
MRLVITIAIAAWLFVLGVATANAATLQPRVILPDPGGPTTENQRDQPEPRDAGDSIDDGGDDHKARDHEKNAGKKEHGFDKSLDHKGRHGHKNRRSGHRSSSHF